MRLDLDEERDVWITPKGISQSPLHGPHAFTCDLYMQVPQDPCPVRSASLGLIVTSLGTTVLPLPRQKPPWVGVRDEKVACAPFQQ